MVGIILAAIVVGLLIVNRSMRVAPSQQSAHQEKTATPVNDSFFPVDNETATLEVEWKTKPDSFVHYAAAASTFQEMIARVLPPEDAQTIAFDFSSRQLRLIGTVTSAIFNGAKIYLWNDDNERWFSPPVRLLITDDGTIRLLTRYRPSDPATKYLDPYAKFFVHAPNIIVPDLEPPPQELVLQNGRKATRVYVGGFRWFHSLERIGTGFTDANPVEWQKVTSDHAGRDVLIGKNNATTEGCVFATTGDGELYWYDFRIPTDETKYQEVYEEAEKTNLLIEWASGYNNNDHYTPYPYVSHALIEPRCPKTEVAEAVGSLFSLTRVATTSDGDSVYTPKYPEQNSVTVEVYNRWRESQHISVRDEESQQPPSITEFYNKYPASVLFWKDPIGRWIRYTSFNALPGLD